MILVLNCGSQSIKWKIFDNDLKPVKEGRRAVLKNYESVLKDELQKIVSSGLTISEAGHRVVHGGEKFRKTLQISSNNLKQLEKISHLAPLHNPFNILGIKACIKIFPKVTQYAVFDTEFYSQLDEKVYTYAIPKNLSKKFGFRKFGFHGISHEYAAKKASQSLNEAFENLKIISCHLGGGTSITAIKNGQAIDTSMGFTPLEGTVMMTRSGSIDPEIILQLAETFSIKKARQILNSESGLKGLCGAGNMLKLLENISKGDAKSSLALDVFVYAVQKYISSYFGILGGCDLLVFTGAIGTGSEKIRDMISKNLAILKNTKIMSIETDEELAIANKILHI